MARSKSSQKWLKEHFTDPYVLKAQKEGMRSRAAYKLKEIHTKDSLIARNMWVVDLGAAPGGWSQIARDILSGTGRLIAIDCLAMDPLAGVEVIQGDFTDMDVVSELKKRLGERPLDLVISDMAPNMTGNAAVDQLRTMQLSGLALEFAEETLGEGGSLLVKAFHGAGFEAFLKQIKKSFGKVLIRKPLASRQRSSEVYILGRAYRGRASDRE